MTDIQLKWAFRLEKKIQNQNLFKMIGKSLLLTNYCRQYEEYKKSPVLSLSIYHHNNTLNKHCLSLTKMPENIGIIFVSITQHTPMGV